MGNWNEAIQKMNEDKKAEFNAKLQEAGLTEMQAVVLRAIMRHTPQSTTDGLRNDNFSWFHARDIVELTSLNMAQVKACMGHLMEKGIIDEPSPDDGCSAVSEKGIATYEKIFGTQIC